MTAIVTLVLLLTITALLASGRVMPMVVFAALPPVAALLLGTPMEVLATAVQSGLSRTAPVATLFLCAICFAGLMRDSGMFQPLMTYALRATGRHPVRVCMVTVLIGMFAHLDGAGPTTFLLAVPVLMPIYDALQLRRSTLLMLLACAAGLFNLLPWAGPLGRVAAVTGNDVTSLWHALLPIQLLGIALLVALAAVAGVIETRRRPAGITLVQVPASIEHPLRQPARASCYPWGNALLCMITLAALVSAILPAWLVFMLALAIALPVNARGLAQQRERLAAHAPAAMELALVVLAAGVLLGTLDGTGMLKALTATLSQWVPAGLLPRQHLLIAMLATPLHLLISTDAYYFALLPLILQSTTAQGVEADAVVNAMTLANTLGGYVGPYSTAVWLALGLTGVSFADYLRRVLPWVWSYTLIMLGTAHLLGLF